MPTELPTRAGDDRRLSLPDSARFLFLVARVRLLDARLHVLVAWGWGLGDDRLLRLMRRWLSYHDAIGALLPGIPEPQHVAEVRAILRPLDEIKARTAALRSIQTGAREGAAAGSHEAGARPHDTPQR